MPTFVTFVLRLFLVTAGLVLMAGVAVVATAVLALWGLRAGWAKLTGRPVLPFAVRINPRAVYRRYRAARPRASYQANTGRAVRPMDHGAEVTDVEVKPKDQVRYGAK